MADREEVTSTEDDGEPFGPEQSEPPSLREEVEPTRRRRAALRNLFRPIDTPILRRFDKQTSFVLPTVHSGGVPFWELEEEHNLTEEDDAPEPSAGHLPRFFSDEDEDEDDGPTAARNNERQQQQPTNLESGLPNPRAHYGQRSAGANGSSSGTKKKSERSRLGQWYHQARSNRAFMDGVLWGLRMGVAGFIAGLFCVLLPKYNPEMGDFLLGSRAFLVPLMTVLATGRTLLMTEALVRDSVVGSIWALAYSLPTAQLIWLAFPGDTADSNYAPRCVMVALVLLVFMPIVSFSPTVPPIEKKVNMAGMIFAMLSIVPGEQTAMHVLYNITQTCVLLGAAAVAAYVIHFFSPRRSTLKAAKRSLMRSVKRTQKLSRLIWRSYRDLNEHSVQGSTLIDIRVGATVLVRKAHEEIEYCRAALKAAESVFPHWGRTRDVSKGVVFLQRCSKSLEYLVGLRRALALHPLFMGNISPWSKLSTDAMPALKELYVHCDAFLGSIIEAQGHTPTSRQPIVDSLALLEDVYRRARHNTFYTKRGDRDVYEISNTSHHLFVFYLCSFAESIVHLDTATLEFPVRSSVLADARGFLLRYFAVHRIPTYVAAYLRAIVERRDEAIRAVLLGIAIVLLCLFQFIPALSEQFPRAAWGPVTAAFCSDVQSTSSTFRAGIQRIVGTTFGTMFGLAGAWISISADIAAPFLGFLAAGFSGYARSSPRWSYAGLVSSFTSVMILYGGVASNTVEGLRSLVLQRLELTLLGVFAVLVASWLWSRSARVSLIYAALKNFQNFDALIRAVFDPWSAHSHHPSDQAYRANVDVRAAEVRASLANQVLLCSMAEEEPMLWRHEFDSKAWAALISAQKSLLQTFEYLKLFVFPGSRSHLLFNEWIGQEIAELQVELSLILDHLSPLVSSGQSLEVQKNSFRLATAELSTPIQINVWIRRLSAKYSMALDAEIAKVEKGARTMLLNSDILPITGFVISINDISLSLDQVWQSTYELYSRHKFAFR